MTAGHTTSGFVLRFPNPQAAAEACGAEILRLLSEAVRTKGRATLAISGGSSPRLMFEYFARTPFDWSRVDIFWVDERCVPPGDPQSNYKLAYDAWFAKDARLKDPGAPNIHRVPTELEPAEAAIDYADDLEPFLPLDVVHRGMGADAHTASLFPGDPQIEDRTATVGVARQTLPRITLMRRVLESAGRTLMLVTGADKAALLRRVLLDEFDPMRFPAQIAARSGDRAAWFVDEAAATELSQDL